MTDPKQLEMFPDLVVGRITPLNDFTMPMPTSIHGKAIQKPKVNQPLYHTLDPSFLKLMDEIGIYGMEKYGKESFEIKRQQGKLTRTLDRVMPDAIHEHACEHFSDANEGIKHDHFNTVQHQFAAAAFNAYMAWAYWVAEQE